MKLLLLVGIVAGGYLYVMTALADQAIAQTQQLNQTYQAIANNAEQLANSGY